MVDGDGRNPAQTKKKRPQCFVITWPFHRDPACWMEGGDELQIGVHRLWAATNGKYCFGTEDEIPPNPAVFSQLLCVHLPAFILCTPHFCFCTSELRRPPQGKGCPGLDPIPGLDRRLGYGSESRLPPPLRPTGGRWTRGGYVPRPP